MGIVTVAVAVSGVPDSPVLVKVSVGVNLPTSGFTRTVTRVPAGTLAASRVTGTELPVPLGRTMSGRL
jgi:hypothetical protein